MIEITSFTKNLHKSNYKIITEIAKIIEKLLRNYKEITKITKKYRDYKTITETIEIFVLHTTY